MSSKKKLEQWANDLYKSEGLPLPAKIIADTNVYDPEPIDVRCYECERTFTLVVDYSRFKAWNNREMLIQDAMPGIEPGYRELLKTHICPDCWKAMFGSPNRRRRR